MNLERLIDESTRIESYSLAPNTRKSYAADERSFRAWCAGAGRDPLPATPETVKLYLTEQIARRCKVTTCYRRASGITYMHRAAGLGNPVTSDVWSLLVSAKRMLQEQAREMRPLTVEQVREISGRLAGDRITESLRNRAIVILGFASALRSASLADLQLRDLEFTEQGLVIHLRREKQDQAGTGRLIGIPPGVHPDTCAAACVEDWLDQRGRWPGPLFTRLGAANDPRGGLHPDTITRAVRRAIARIGLDPSEYSGHSLRAGFITEAGERNVNELRIAHHTGHKSLEVLRRYFRRRDVFRANVCRAIGL